MKIVWIVWSSLIQNAFEHTSNRPTGANLGLEKYGVQLVWVGMRGMKWENLMSLISGLLNCYGLPHAIMIHCGGEWYRKFENRLRFTYTPDESGICSYIVWNYLVPQLFGRICCQDWSGELHLMWWKWT
jgi:hypothetical protein